MIKTFSLLPDLSLQTRSFYNSEELGNREKDINALYRSYSPIVKLKKGLHFKDTKKKEYY